MKILVAPNAFKGALDAAGAAEAIAAGLRDARPGLRLRLLPVADGGDGTLAVLAKPLGLAWRRKVVRGPRAPVAARWAMGGARAFVELAAASGLALLSGKPNPYRTTSYGTGELLVEAARQSAREIFLTVGGSATVDGALGCLQALGAQVFVNRRRLSRPATGYDLVHLTDVAPPPWSLPITVLVDVRNPLLGERGSARAFGPQKGATSRQVRALERGLARLAKIIGERSGRKVAALPGAGAAGGVAAGLAGFLGARIVPGAPWVLDRLQADRWIRWADVVITGEGRWDLTSGEGKATGELLRRARLARKPVVILAGQAGSVPRGARLILLGPQLSIPERIRRTAALLRAAARTIRW